MKVLGNLPIIKDSDVNMPFGAAIQNETDTQDGTPIIREIYNDILMNIYRILELTNIVPTDTEDSDVTQYQIVEALKKLPNSLNDMERDLILTGTVFSVDIDLSVLPNKYFFICRCGETYVPGVSYTFKGTDVSPVYSFTSNGFKDKDLIMVIIDTGAVRAYNLNVFSEFSDIMLSLGNPISYNDTAKLMYENDGIVYSDLPSVDYLENIIKSDSADTSLIVNDILVLKGFILCFCYSVDDNQYLFYQFNLLDLETSFLVDSNSILDNATDFEPYIYTDGIYLYLTNEANQTADDFAISKLNYEPLNEQITTNSSFDIENTFVKTSNAVVKSNKLYTLQDGTLTYFSLTSPSKTILGVYNSVIGRLFQFNNQIYFGTESVAKPWTI